jgi:signal transduction histidine kinase
MRANLKRSRSRVALPEKFGFDLFGRSLSARVLWLTVSIILLVEIAILMPSLGRERQAWLWDRLSQANLAAFSLAAASENRRDGMVDEGTRLALLQLSGTEAIRLVVPGKATLVLPDSLPSGALTEVDLSSENLATSMWRADLSLFGLGGQLMEVAAASPIQSGMVVQVIIQSDALTAYLRQYVAHIAALSVIIALVTGLLVFAALDRLLVRPMRIITASIVGFRQDPEHVGLSDLSWLSQQRDDEIAGAARELAVMQDELRAALWRNARLAALGTAVAKISHDLRNILSSALLVADRLEESVDPAAQRAAKTLIPAVERAAELVSRTVDFAREGPPAIIRSKVMLRGLIDEAAAVIRPDEAGVVLENLVPGDVALQLDRAQIYRVLVNLMRNAVEAGAKRLVTSIEVENGTTSLLVADDGPGLPEKVQKNLFKPFTGSGRRGGTGLGLAIARDLIRAHGGDLLVKRTDQWGTVFTMGLAMAEMQAPVVPEAANVVLFNPQATQNRKAK